MQDKSDKIGSNIIKREIGRKLDIEKKREDKNLCLAENEKLEFFTNTVSEKKFEIENALNLSLNIRALELPNHFDNISKNILQLQKYVAGCNIFLRSYDVERCHQNIQELTNKLRDLEESLLPKKKFGFKNKNKYISKEQKAKVNGHSRDTVDFGKKTIINLNENFCGFENRKNETLLLKTSEILKKDVTIRKLENCVVKLYGSPSTIHLNQLRNCVIFTGPVSTSIFADDCTNCYLIIACQQLRLHSSTNIHIYLHVTSRAIMEDCKNVLIAPYNLIYEGIGEDFITSGLDMNTNNWTAIDDFNWLNTEVKSPNWSVLDENERISDWKNFTLPCG